MNKWYIPNTHFGNGNWLPLYTQGAFWNWNEQVIYTVRPFSKLKLTSAIYPRRILKLKWTSGIYRTHIFGTEINIRYITCLRFQNLNIHRIQYRTAFWNCNITVDTWAHVSCEKDTNTRKKSRVPLGSTLHTLFGGCVPLRRAISAGSACKPRTPQHKNKLFSVTFWMYHSFC